jgi:NAD(P)-dependent dehydrogenase (short-subunit alcohol dehydrogenase family)
MAAPVGLQLAFHTLVPLLGVVMLPVTLAFGPSAAYNLLLIVLPGLAGYAMYRAARLWLTTRVGAIAAGAFFGLSGMLTYQDWYHINIAYGTAFLPVTLEAAVRLRRKPSLRQAVILGAVLAGCLLVNQESAVMALILAALVLAGWLLQTRTLAAARTRLGATAAAAVAFVVLGSPQLIAMLQQTLAGGTTVTLDTLGYTSWVANVQDLVAPSPRLADDPGLAGLGHIYYWQTTSENLNTFGVVLSVLAVGGLIVTWRRRSAWLLALLWLGGTALALGPVLSVGHHTFVPLAQSWEGLRVSALMPYTWFIRVPGLSIFREADRMALLALVGAALLAGAAVDWMQRRRAWPAIVVVAVLAALEAGWPGSPMGAPAMPTTPAALDRPIAADHSGSTVVDVPFGQYVVPQWGQNPVAQAILLATEDGHPRAFTYSSWVPSKTLTAIQQHAFYFQLNQAQYGTAATPAQLAAARADLRSLHVGWVLVWPPGSSPALSRYLSGTGFQLAYQADGVSVYRPVSASG